MISAQNILPAGQYSIKETASILGIHRDTLRKYTDSGALKCSYRRATLKKFYKGVDILNFIKGEIR